MAIDIKGGVNDARNEVWLFRLNNSPAQQWVFEYQETNNNVKRNKKNNVIIPDKKNKKMNVSEVGKREKLIQIRSKHVELYFEAYNGKVKMNDLNNKNSQLWKILETGEIVN